MRHKRATNHCGDNHDNAYDGKACSGCKVHICAAAWQNYGAALQGLD